MKNDAADQGVDLRLLNLDIDDPWNSDNGESAQERDGYTLMDVYPHADLITYPSLYEGFGNAFLEAIYFKKPILINRDAIFVRDIEPQEFDLIVMDGFLTQKNIEEVKEVLMSEKRREQMVETNYQIAKKHYSYAVLRKKLNYLLNLFFGLDE